MAKLSKPLSEAYTCDIEEIMKNAKKCNGFFETKEQEEKFQEAIRRDARKNRSEHARSLAKAQNLYIH